MRLNGGKFVSALDSTFVNSHLKFSILSVTFLNCEVSRNVYYKGDFNQCVLYCIVNQCVLYCIIIFSVGGYDKTLDDWPHGKQ